MLPDTTPILPPLEPSPDDRGGHTTGPASDFDYVRPAAPAPIPPFDPLAAVKDRPWLSLGLAAVAGLGAGLMLFYRPKKDQAAAPTPPPQPVMGHPPAAPKEESGPSLFDSIVGGIGAELASAGKQVMDELSGALKEKAQGAMDSVKGLIGQTAGAEPTGV